MLKISLFIFLSIAKPFAYESMIRKGYTSCLGCHYSPRGGGILTDYGKMVAFSEAPLKLRSLEESSLKKSLRFGGMMDHGVHLRVANVDTEVSNDSFPMQGDYLNAFRFKNSVLLTTLAKAPVRRSQSSVEKPAFIDTVYFRDLKLVHSLDNKHFFTLGRERQNLGLKLTDHTLFVKNYNKSNVTDIATFLSYDYVGKDYELTLSSFGPNFQEGIDNKEYGGKVELRRKIARSVFGISFLKGKTNLVSRDLLGIFGKISPTKYISFFSENIMSSRKTSQNIEFSQRTHMIGVLLSPISSMEMSLSAEDIRREDPFYIDQQRAGMNIRQRIFPNLTFQFDWKRTFLSSRNENILISQLFINGR